MITVCKKPFIQLDINEDSTIIYLNRIEVTECITKEEIKESLDLIMTSYDTALSDIKKYLISDFAIKEIDHNKY